MIQNVSIKIFHDINVELEPSLIRVHSDVTLWKYLQGKNLGKLVALVAEIKSKYAEEFNRPLKIRDSSMLVEILAHVYCHRVGVKINQQLNDGVLRNFLQKLINRAKVADCGERDRDGNRWFWDILAHFKTLVVLLFPRNLL